MPEEQMEEGSLISDQIHSTYTSSLQKTNFPVEDDTAPPCC